MAGKHRAKKPVIDRETYLGYIGMLQAGISDMFSENSIYRVRNLKRIRREIERYENESLKAGNGEFGNVGMRRKA